MLYIIIAIIVISLFWGLLKSAGKALVYFAGGIIILSLAVYIIREYGMLLLKIVGIGVAVIVLISILSLVKTAADAKRYKAWIDVVGIGANKDAPGNEAARQMIIDKGEAVCIGVHYTAAPWFLDKLNDALQEVLLVDPSELGRVTSSLCDTVNMESIGPLMEYLTDTDLLIPVFSPEKELCGVSPVFFGLFREDFNKKGAATPAEFQSLLTEKYSQNCSMSILIWLASEVLRLLVEKGDVEIVPTYPEDKDPLYLAKSPAPQCEMTTEELFWDE